MERRLFLKTAAVLSTAYFLFSNQNPVEVRAQPQITRYDRLRLKMKSTGISSEFGKYFLDRIGEIEKTEAFLNQMESPNLETLYTKKYSSLLFTPSSERLFLTRDRQAVSYMHQIIDSLNEEDNPHKVIHDFQELYHNRGFEFFISPLVQINPSLEQRRITLPYWKANTEPRKNAIEIVPALEPTPSKQNLFDQDSQEIKTWFSGIPRLRNLRIKLVSPERYGTANPPDLPEKASFSFDENWDTITLILDSNKGFDFYQARVLIHEWGHSIDLLTNYMLWKVLTPEQIIQLLTLQEQAQQSIFGRDHPFVKKIYEAQDLSKKPDPDGLINAHGFRQLTGQYPSNVWLSEQFNNFLGKGDVYGQASWMMKVLGLPDLRQLAFQYLGEEKQNKVHRDLASFLKDNNELIIKIKKSNRGWNFVFNLLEQNKAIWSGENTWYGNILPTLGDRQAWLGFIMSVCTNALVTDTLYQGNYEVINAFPEETVKKAAQEAKARLEDADQEKFAEAISYAFILENSGQLESNLYSDYLIAFSGI